MHNYRHASRQGRRAFQLSRERLRFRNQSSGEGRANSAGLNKKKKNIEITERGRARSTKCTNIFDADAHNVSSLFSFFDVAVGMQRVSSVLRCSYSLSFSLFFRRAQHPRQKREKERECLQHTLRVTHTAAPSINRCVCCFNLPWARDQRDKGQISAKIVCETCRQTR